MMIIIKIQQTKAPTPIPAYNAMDIIPPELETI